MKARLHRGWSVRKPFVDIRDRTTVLAYHPAFPWSTSFMVTRTIHRSVHCIKTLHFCYTNMSKLHPYTYVHNANQHTFPVQICLKIVYTKHYTLLCKHIKIVSLYICPPHQTLHFPYAKSQKLCPYTNVYHVNPLHFATPRCQNCVHKHLSTISKTLHISYTNTSKLCPYADVHYIK
jgi:hypothetical protein